MDLFSVDQTNTNSSQLALLYIGPWLSHDWHFGNVLRLKLTFTFLRSVLSIKIFRLSDCFKEVSLFYSDNASTWTRYLFSTKRNSFFPLEKSIKKHFLEKFEWKFITLSTQRVAPIKRKSNIGSENQSFVRDQ